MRPTHFVCPADGVGDAFWEPEADVFQTRYGYVIKFNLAGIRLDDIRLEVVKQTLILRGVRRDMMIEESAVQYRLEISYSHFRKCIEFDSDISTADISTDYSDGMLFVRIRLERS